MTRVAITTARGVRYESEPFNGRDLGKRLRAFARGEAVQIVDAASGNAIVFNARHVESVELLEEASG